MTKEISKKINEIQKILVNMSGIITPAIKDVTSNYFPANSQIEQITFPL